MVTPAALGRTRGNENSLPAPRSRNRSSRRGVRLANSKRASGIRARVRREGRGRFCHRWYETGTGRYTTSDPASRWGLIPIDPLYAYALSNPLRFIDPSGLKVIIDDSGIQDHYDQLKKCYPLFRSLAGYFEAHSSDWRIRLVPSDRPYLDCQLGSNRDADDNTVFVPQGRDCTYTKECIFHEFYERWAIDGAGLAASQGGAGPAHDRAQHFEKLLPPGCCGCDPETAE